MGYTRREILSTAAIIGAGFATQLTANPAENNGASKPAPTAPVKTGRVETEGDELYYEVRGHGEPLLMISGGHGDAGFYEYVANSLADEYQVITYDRRGNSRSTRREPQNFEVGQQARDAVAVLRAVGHQSAFVFGNSAGAVIGLEMARSQPRFVKALVAHEPPSLRVLPDASEQLAKFAEYYLTALRESPEKAMAAFVSTILIPQSVYAHFPSGFGERISKNQAFFLTSEMLPVVHCAPDIEMIKKNRVKVFMAGGKDTLDASKYYGVTAPIIADRLGCEMIVFPGHHLSYLDMPLEWAAVLRKVLQKAV